MSQGYTVCLKIHPRRHSTCRREVVEPDWTQQRKRTARVCEGILEGDRFWRAL